MDYKYIECLIERYFNCETTSHEENILRSFFMQDTVPAHLEQYKPMFQAMADEAEIELPEDFDAKLNERINSLEHKKTPVPVKMRISRFNRAMGPFYKAVASVALIITVGVTSSIYWNSQEPEPVKYNYSKYQDTYSDPEVAYEQVSTALNTLSDVLNANDEADADSLEAVNATLNN